MWIIFDEMDERIGFQARPSDLPLPEFDRLSEQSCAALNAYPPAGMTRISVPALTIGRLVAKAEPVGAYDLRLTFEGKGESGLWSEQPSIFSKANEAGFGTAIVGWYHPYCRVIGKSLDFCSWGPLYIDQSKHENATVFGTMMVQARLSFVALPFIVRTRKLKQSRGRPLESERESNLRVYGGILDQAKKNIVDKSLNLIFLHFPVPHLPAIYDRQKGDFSTTGKGDYLDNLALADRTLGELRRELERAGMWDETNLLITSDHSLRHRLWRGLGEAYLSKEDLGKVGNQGDSRVPFLLKLRDQQRAIVYETAFNTVITSDLLLAIMKGEIGEPGSVTKWLEEHHTIAASPYDSYDELAK